MHFEWDGAKAERNRSKHGVTFDEAVTIFHDPLSATFDDPDHSTGERRLITVGYSSRERLLIVSHVESGETSGSLAQDQPPPQSVNAMKPKPTDDLRPEYDFDYSKAVRGKYYKRLLKEGSNVVVLERDVAKAFPSSESVNEALRSVLKSRRARRLTARPTRTRA